MESASFGREGRHAPYAVVDAAHVLGARYDHERVGPYAREGALDGEGRSVADLHHGDDRRDTDDDAERGEQGSHDVTSERACRPFSEYCAISWGASGRSLDEAVLDADGPPGVMGHARIVRDENDGDPIGLVELLEHLEYLLARMRIEVPRGLIRKEHLGTVDERSRYGDTLLLPAGELGRLMMGPVGQAHFFEHLYGPLPLLMLGEVLPCVAEGHENVLQRSRAGRRLKL